MQIKGLHILFFLINITWGVIQSSLGLMLFLCFITRPHYWYKSSIVTVNTTLQNINIKGGLCLGLFIFVTVDMDKEHIVNSDLIKHEYGHVLQSVLLGPLYLLIIGLPSLIWARFFSGWRKKHNKDYCSLYTESWAVKWGNL